MTEDDKKNLTKWLGKRWHEEIEACKCSCGRNFGDSLLLDYHIEDLNRTYDNDADMLELFRKLVGKELWLWSRFLDFVGKYHNRSFETGLTYQEFFAALFYYPERFCNLVAEFKPWEK